MLYNTNHCFSLLSRSVIWIKIFCYQTHDRLKTSLVFITHILYPWAAAQTLFLAFLQYTNCSCSSNAYIYASHTQVCTQKRWSSVSTLLSKKSGSTLRCEWRCGPPLPSVLLPSQYTNTIPQPAVWCGNCMHISCQPERFFGGPNPAWLRWDSLALSPAVKSSLDRKIEAKCESSLAVEKRSEGEAWKPETWFRPVKNK